MFSCSMKDKVEEKGEWPCGVCKKGVGNNSILCHGCKKWILCSSIQNVTINKPTPSFYRPDHLDAPLVAQPCQSTINWIIINVIIIIKQKPKISRINIKSQCYTGLYKFQTLSMCQVLTFSQSKSPIIRIGLPFPHIFWRTLRALINHTHYTQCNFTISFTYHHSSLSISSLQSTYNVLHFIPNSFYNTTCKQTHRNVAKYSVF